MSSNNVDVHASSSTGEGSHENVEVIENQPQPKKRPLKRGIRTPTGVELEAPARAEEQTLVQGLTAGMMNTLDSELIGY